MQSPSSTWFHERFGNRFELTMDKTDDLRNDRTGYFIATSIEGSGTGFGGDICVGDDLLSAQEARSKTIRDATNHWLDDTFRRRLNNPTTGVFVHVSQRLADDDPTGHLLEKNPSEWIHVKIKREAEDDEVYVFPLSGRIHKRAKGDVLQPERCPPHVLCMKRTHRSANEKTLGLSLALSLTRRKCLIRPTLLCQITVVISRLRSKPLNGRYRLISSVIVDFISYRGRLSVP
jgi:hypothetical protein